MLAWKKVLPIFIIAGILPACITGADTAVTSEGSTTIEYYAAHDLAMLSVPGVDVEPAVVFDLANGVARFDHVHAEIEACASEERYYCIRGSITMPFAVPKHYTGDSTWAFGGYTYHALPKHGDLQILGFDLSTIQFYVDVPVTLAEEQAFRRYVFIWSAEFGLIGWTTAMHGCSISKRDLMDLAISDVRQACLLRSLVIARGNSGLFAR